jgi:hypothetical protein
LASHLHVNGLPNRASESFPRRITVQRFAYEPVNVSVCLENSRPAASVMSSPSPQSSPSPPQTTPKGSSKDIVSDANIRNFAPVARIMKMALPDNAKIAKEAKECMQECVSEFISFITSEGEF